MPFMRIYVDLSRAASTHLEMACLDNEVAGFLLGRINGDAGGMKRLSAGWSYLKSGSNLLLGRPRLRRPLVFARKFFATELKVRQCTTDSEAEVVLFVVEAKQRGRGIGRALMDRFVSVVRERQARTITLYTEPLSNWRFYEHYGFTRRATFIDDLDTYFRKEETEGYVYALNL